MVEKVTRMLIKVDLQCGKCYRKIKKVLCSFPEIRDQIYDEKQNTVIITVVCCSPEKVKAKICCKGGDTILGIAIIPDKPISAPPPKPDPPRKLVPPSPPRKLVPLPPPHKPVPLPPPHKPAPLPPPPPPHKPVPPPKPVPFPCLPGHVVGTCCCPPCYGGYGPCCCPPCYGGYGPCCYGYRPPQMCHDGCGRPACECQGRNRGYYVSSCGDCFSEENASGCTVM